jgi:rSAM/selenodomain-associated transferase 1
LIVVVETKPLLIVMAKAPRLLQGKSRLAASLGAVEALRINRRLHAKTFQVVRDPRWRVILAASPDKATSLQLPMIWPASIPRVAQGRGDLGERLQRMARLAQFAPVAVIGSDCPELSQRRIAHAFRCALRDGAHAIPACDGGFVLLATRTRQIMRCAFEQVRWSSPHTLADVCDNLARAGQRISISAALPDIDTADDWAAFARKSRSCAR